MLFLLCSIFTIEYLNLFVLCLSKTLVIFPKGSRLIFSAILFLVLLYEK
nr:MAG TPA: hypothetical protein [Caudoviricetes sp.]